MKRLEYHPLADILPLIEGREYETLRDDIHANGLIEPIWLYQGKILDGRNRYCACCEIGIEPRFREYVGNDPAGFVVSLNLARRHLDESQRAMVAAKLATMKEGRPSKTGSIELVSQERAADLLNVGRESVKRARVVWDSGHTGLIELVRQAEVAVSAAASVAKESVSFITSFVGKVLSGTKTTEALRQCRKEALPAKIAALPDGVYRVLYADPPWQYNDARRTGDHRETTGVLAHYSEMTLDELKALDIRRIAGPDSVLLCWATFPLLEDALELVKQWGFAYKQAFIWDKEHGSFGHYHDAEAELILIATRGSGTPDQATKEKQIQRFARTKHSRKPSEWRTLIDRLYTPHPTKRDRLEMFPGSDIPSHWDTWGAAIGETREDAA
jgi:N6-adenosine-specific RNA methylase IME4